MMEKENKFVRFHALQGLLFAVAYVLINTGLGLRWRNWGLNINSYMYITADPNVDMVNISPTSKQDVNDSGTPVLTQLRSFADSQAELAGRGLGTGVADAVNFSAADQALAGNISNRITQSGIFDAATATNLANELVYQASEFKTNLSYTAGGQTYNLDQASLDFVLPILVQSAIDIETGGATSNSIDSNTTNTALNGLVILEAALTYSRESMIPSLPKLDMGAAFKVMRGSVGYYKLQLKSETLEADDVKDKFDKYTKDTINLGLDLGFMYSFDFMKSKAGLVIKNINSPKFDQPDVAVADGLSPEIKLEPSARLGFSAHPWRRVFVSTDIDLTENNTILLGYKERMFGAGLELYLLPESTKLFNIALRGGFKTNLAESDAGTVLSGGLGFNFLHGQLDFGGTYNTKKVADENGDEIPQELGFNLTLSLNF